MRGWLFGGWPPPPPAANESTLAVATPLLLKPYQVGPLAVAAGASVVIPAPAAGLIRVLHSIQLTSLGATPNFNVTLEPSGLFIVGRSLTGGAATSAPALIPGSGSPFAFGANETVKVANGGSADAVLMYWYNDVSATGRALIRAQYAANPGNAAVELIPAAPAGFYSRLLPFVRQAGLGMSLFSTAHIFNDDVAAVVSDILFGAVVSGRVASLAAAASSANPQGNTAEWIVTTAALNVKAQAAATDPIRRPVVFACYETLPVGVP